MLRFIAILIGLFNIFAIYRAWFASLTLFFNQIESFLPKNVVSVVGIAILVILFLFFIIHSGKLVLFHESARKNQMIISCIDPLLRIIMLLLVYKSNIDIMPAKSAIISSLVIVTCLDIFIILYLRREKIKNSFQEAEENREQKFRMKLMNK